MNTSSFKFPSCVRWPLIFFCSSVFAGAYAPGIDTLISIPTWNDGDTSWWYARHQEIKERVHHSGALVLMMGDSITQGWEDEGNVIWEQFYSRRRAINLGFNKDRTEDLLWRLQNSEVAGVSPKLAIVMIGSNNIAAGQSAQITASGIQAIVLTLRERLPHTKILLLAIFPRSYSPDDSLRRSIRSVNKLIAQYADGQHIVYLDLTEKFLDDQGYLSEEVMPDFVHPNQAGYRIWAEGMEETINELLNSEETD